MSAEEVERIKRQHEGALVEELRIALPHVHLKEIKRLVKELGDGNKVLEFLTGVESQDIQPQQEPASTDLPNGTKTPEEPSQDPHQDTLSASMEILSLNPEPEPSETPPEVPTPPTFSTDLNDPKHKARQRRQASAARKEKQAKQAQKEAAKRRKRMEAVAGMDKMDDTTGTIAKGEHILKAIVI